MGIQWIWERNGESVAAAVSKVAKFIRSVIKMELDKVRLVKYNLSLAMKTKWVLVVKRKICKMLCVDEAWSEILQTRMRNTDLALEMLNDDMTLARLDFWVCTASRDERLKAEHKEPLVEIVNASESENLLSVSQANVALQKSFRVSAKEQKSVYRS